jgi:hypothetical protein
MTNNFFRQAGKSAQDIARQMAKTVAQEPSEILRSAKSQVVGGVEQRPNSSGPSVVDQIVTQDGKFGPASAAEEQSIHARAQSRLAQIEAELRQIRMQRERSSQEWSHEQDKLMQQGQQEKHQETVEPQGKKHGAQRPGKKSSNSMETSKQKKG